MNLNSVLGLAGLLLSAFNPLVLLKGYQITPVSLQITDWTGGLKREAPWRSVQEVIRIERGLFMKPTGSLSRTVLKTDSGIVTIPGTVAWPSELERAIYACAPVQRTELRLKWFGGFPALAALVLVPVIFLFADAAFYPTLTVPQQAWLAVIVVTLIFLLNAVYLTSILRHYIQSTLLAGVRPVVWIGMVIFSLLLLIAAPLARRLVFPLAGYGVVAGAVALWNILECHPLAAAKGIPGRAIRTARVLSGLAGVALLAFTWGPVTANVQTYSYSIAILKSESALSQDAARIGPYFDALGLAGKIAVFLDPSYYQGHYAIAWAEFHAGNYDASLGEYTRAIQSLDAPDDFPPYYYCRALAFSAAGDLQSAVQDYHHYLALRPEMEIPACYNVFRNFTGPFPLP